MGASLLAKAVSQSLTMLNVMASSRASSLPQGICVASSIQVRVAPRALAANWSAGSTCLRSSTR
ncbi:hypothetical protein DBR24_02215 [Pseudomonas sp. HMWF006]|nr:hypothetical protein DBR24_02215 [Pseudomonas sp. HMWF006]PTT59581.1 hypothetical protein DBR26_30935 [Pseudomonas sp. HMWF007]PTT95117.1 hypothetical protein DBR29_01220 [Pseudomonas sp. HMWF005]